MNKIEDKKEKKSKDDVYRRLIDWIKQNMVRPPSIFDTDEFISLMKATYTPEEASSLIGVPLTFGMPFAASEIKEIAKSKNMTLEEFSERLDALAKKGLVYRVVEGRTTRYSLFDPISVYVRSAFWPGRTDEWSKGIAPLVNRYYYQGLFDIFKDLNTKLARVIPIQEVIEDSRQVLPYEVLNKILDSLDYFCVATCACRHRKNIDPDFPSCKYPTETCLHFDELAHYIVDNGLGREITRQEAREILRQCAELGLVHTLSAWQEKVDTICNCCRDCCVWLESFTKLKHHIGHFPSNFRVRTNPETCIGCGLCVKRCPMEALRLEDLPEAKGRITTVAADNKNGKKELKNEGGKVAILNYEICIGCGVCAYKCPTKSLVLERREDIHTPPKTSTELAIKLVNEIITEEPQKKT